MRKETLTGTILSIKYQAILLPRQNRVLPLCLILYFQKERRKLRKLEIAEIAEIAEDEPAPAPAPTLETVKEQPHTPGTRKSTRKNFGKQ